ncbi:autotransporter outer membrane beta-barrel domain-containing protein [Endozoicomonas sp. 8E]|uniref:autotransporter outer membrane beta-barrel domain-containing protein n=1 Tax=Endozoicomonas sp. 8E TaxID=3035692 RepID=UPI002939270E|nr:autotransporter outer membrane beta-barrel domain-containing protein [Endozoicomonas sp. 8E]WOG29157.1 autotransporter outer membrane beta-barrel domain-containing protein [Endozoicomonas sp. 8E]
MNVRSNLSHPVRLVVLGSIAGGCFVPVMAEPGVQSSVTTDETGNSAIITYSKTMDAKATIDTDRVYQLGEDGQYYFKARNIAQPIKEGKLVPVERLGSAVLSVPVTPSIPDALNHPAIADKIMIESSLAAYGHFAGLTRGILNGRIPVASITGVEGGLLEKTPSALLKVERGHVSSEVDYLGQDENTEIFVLSTVSERAAAFVSGDWFGLVELYGHFYDQDKMSNMAGFKSSGYGIQLGLVRQVAEDWLFGVYGAWQKLDADLKGYNGELDTGTWRLGPTVAWSKDGFHAEGLLTYNWNTIDSKVPRYNSDFKSREWDAYIRGGYDINLDSLIMGLTLTPEVQFLYVSQDRDEYNWAMGMIGKGSSRGWVSRMGGSLSYDCFLINQPMELKASLGWQHNDYEPDDIEYMNSEYNSYDENAAYYSLGMETQLSGQLNLNIGYAGTWSENALGHYLQAGLEFRF